MSPYRHGCRLIIGEVDIDLHRARVSILRLGCNLQGCAKPARWATPRAAVMHDFIEGPRLIGRRLEIRHTVGVGNVRHGPEYRHQRGLAGVVVSDEQRQGRQAGGLRVCKAPVVTHRYAVDAAHSGISRMLPSVYRLTGFQLPALVSSSAHTCCRTGSISPFATGDLGCVGRRDVLNPVSPDQLLRYSET